MAAGIEDDWINFDVHLQGVRPQAFEKVENAEIRDIIDCCTKLRKDERYEKPNQKSSTNPEMNHPELN